MFPPDRLGHSSGRSALIPIPEHRNLRRFKLSHYQRLQRLVRVEHDAVVHVGLHIEGLDLRFPPAALPGSRPESQRSGCSVPQ